MDSILFTNLDACLAITQKNLGLLLYSHIPTACVALIIGFFVLLRNKKDLVNILLFLVSLNFALWVAIDLFVWLYFYKIGLTMLSWSFFGLFFLLTYILSLYFYYVFIDRKDISFCKKIIFFLILLPVIIFIPTRMNLSSFDATNCEVSEGNYYPNYYYLAGLSIFLWILISSFIKIKKLDSDRKKQALLLTIGLEFFLGLFLVVGFLVSYLNDNGIIQNYNYELYGLFGMPVFLGFLAYLIVKFKAFNIKMLATEALVAALVILVSAELFFAESATNQILILITMLISLGFGYMLVKSVKLEVQRKEELQMMSDKLAVANDQLRKLDNAKSEFISIASHQLRTPLTAIKGFLSLILEGSYGKLQTKQEDVLNKVYTSNERLVQLVEDLLNVSRMESGRMEFKLAKTKIEDICKEVVDTFVIKAKNLNLKLDYTPPKVAMPELMIDGVKIREVVSNFVDNALKYTPKGGVTLRLELADNAVRIITSDTGIGIPSTELPYLFTKFSRGKNISRLNTGGTGLGLYVGKGIVEANGGRVWAESDGEGLGSRFIIELPVEQSKEVLERWG